MLLLSKYAFHNDSEAIKRLNEKSITIAVPKFWGGYIAITKKPNDFYRVVWFASNKSKSFKSAICSIENK